MELQQIDVFIDKDGQVLVEVRGARGRECLDLTAALEEALGGKVVAREMTAEAQEAVGETVEERQRQRQGRG